MSGLPGLSPARRQQDAPLEWSVEWRARLVSGVAGGLLVALALLFTLTSLGVSIRQTGQSAGKSVFFGTWAVVVGLSLLVGRSRAFVETTLSSAGVLLISAALRAVCRHGTASWSPAFAEVTIGLFALGAVLCASGPWLYRARKKKSVERA